MLSYLVLFMKSGMDLLNKYLKIVQIIDWIVLIHRIYE